MSSVSSNLLGIEFAPVWVPLERRLQTFATLLRLLTLLLLSPLGFLILAWLLFWSNGYQWIGIFYLLWVIYDWKTPERGGRKWRYNITTPLNKYFKDYFPIELIKTADLDPDGRYLLCSHPHGVMPAGILCSLGTKECGWFEKFPGLDIRFCTLPINFSFLGLHRELFLGCGMVSATKSSMEYLFTQTKGIVTVLVPGGAHEARNWAKDEIKLYLKKRKGFIKLALRFGVDIVPTFSFNEQFIYNQILAEKDSKLMKFYNFVEATLGFIPVIFFGRGIFNYNFGLLPYRKPINVVVGAPIKINQISNPSKEEIEKTHQHYMRELQKLYNKYNQIYGDERVKLVFE